MAGIYIHIPFCRQACAYCDFYFSTHRRLQSAFVDALSREIASAPRLWKKTTIKTLYFGGGTPSALTLQQLGLIFQTLKDHFEDFHPSEVSFEVNPEDIHEDYLQGLSELGITRLSMGIQSFNDKLLTVLNRNHNAERAFHAVQTISSSPINNLSVDLMYGLPQQNEAELSHDLEIFTRLPIQHISAYALTIEPNTLFGRRHREGRLSVPPNDEVSHFMELVRTHLSKHDFNQYEVSNFAKPGNESKHNHNYWFHVPYFGFGPSAHSFWFEKDAPIRRNTEAHLRRYCEGSARTETEELSQLQFAEETIMLRLRTRQGLNVDDLQNWGYRLSSKQESTLEIWEREGWACVKPTSICLKPKGLNIADHLTANFCAQH